MPKATALYDSKPERKGHARLRAQHRSFIIISIINNFAKRAPTFLFLTGRTWKSNIKFIDSLQYATSFSSVAHYWYGWKEWIVWLWTWDGENLQSKQVLDLCSPTWSAISLVR